MSIVRTSRWVGGGLRAILHLASCEPSLSLSVLLAERLANRGASAAPRARDGAIVCVGDSNTFGVGAPAGRSYPDPLRELLVARGIVTPVENLGMAGFVAERAVARLERRLQDDPPKVVIFLAGINDMARVHLHKLAPERVTLLGVLRHLRTFQLLETGYRVARGDVAREEFGGSSADADGLPAPSEVGMNDWQREFERALARGGTRLVDWLEFWGKQESVVPFRRAFDAVLADPQLREVTGTFRFPVEFIRFEEAMLSGTPIEPVVAPPDVSAPVAQYAEFTGAWALLHDGRLAEARQRFDALWAMSTDPYFQGYVRLHRAWATLLERDFAAAARELDVVVPGLLELSPQVGVIPALGAAALARVLSDPSARIPECLGPAASAWKERYSWPTSPLGHEWMMVAEWVGAVGRGDAAAARTVRARLLARFGPQPATAPARFVAGPSAEKFERLPASSALEQLAAELPLEAPRASWFGPRKLYFRRATGDEVGRLLAPSMERLAMLSSKHGFAVVLLTYLSPDVEAVHQVLRTTAQERGWPIVDLHQLHDATELVADNRRRFFSADRGHPNERGYGLIASDVLDELMRAGLVR